MSGQLFLTLIIAMLVFGPSKLPMLARHLGQLMRSYQTLKQQLLKIWQHQINAQQLEENLKRAQEADASYQPSSDKP